MEKTVQAICENGALRPLEPLLLEERQRVTVTITDATGIAPDRSLLIASEEWADGAIKDVRLDEVRRALSTIHGSLSETILEERRER